MPARRRAFTLVELLVVLGVITVLIAILLPALARVREHANRIKCAANLRSIGQAITMYTQQYAYYPCGEVLGAGPTTYALWPVRLRPFMGPDRRIFRCPSQDDRCEWSFLSPAPPAWSAGSEEVSFGYEPGEAVISGLGSYFSYGYNLGGDLRTTRREAQLGLGSTINVRHKEDPASGELPASRVRVASEMIAVADSTADGLGDYAIAPLPHVWPGIVHGGGANVLFCDGHVQWYLQADVVIPYWSHPHRAVVQQMWNNDHLVHD